MKNLFLFLLVCIASVIAADAQIGSGGSYTIEKSVMAGGGANGATVSAGGNYTVEGTFAQNAAGTKQQSTGFTFQPGFWNAAPTFAPTAAAVSVGGRILTADGSGIRHVLVTLTGAYGETRTVISGRTGNYRFADVPAGATYIFSVYSKRFSFSQPTQVRSIVEDTDDINFIADVSESPIK